MLPGMLPKKILESRIPEMTFPEFNFSTNYIDQVTTVTSQMKFNVESRPQ